MIFRSPRGVAAAERPMFHVALIAVLCALMLSACHGRPTPEVRAGDVAPDTYQLGPGDDVRINVFGDESLSGEHKVAGDGALAMPLVGRIQAAGLTATELKESLESRLAEYMREPRVTVQILSNRPFYILGEVNNPGSYAYVDGMTVMNAVAIAGGFTYRAREGDFVIDRQTLDEPVAGGLRTPILPGDVITVEERYF